MLINCPRCNNPSFQDGKEFDRFQDCSCGLHMGVVYLHPDMPNEVKYTEWTLFQRTTHSVEFYPFTNAMAIDDGDIVLPLDWKITKERIDKIKLLH